MNRRTMSSLFLMRMEQRVLHRLNIVGNRNIMIFYLYERCNPNGKAG